jgi:MYXO-CTERM domain-containing protein
MKYSLLLPLTVSFFSSAPVCSAAVTAINNVGAGTQGFSAGLSGPTGEIFGFPYENRQVAFSFTTGPVPVEVVSLRFVISQGDVLTDPIHLALSTGSPVAGPVSSVSLGDVAPAVSPITQILTSAPPATVTLDAATTYWVHVTVPSGGAIYSFLNNNVPVFEPGWSMGNTFFYDPLDGWTELTSGPQARIQLNVQAVPEPGAALLGLGALAGCLARRRRA